MTKIRCNHDDRCTPSERIVFLIQEYEMNSDIILVVYYEQTYSCLHKEVVSVLILAV